MPMASTSRMMVGALAQPQLFRPKAMIIQSMAIREPTEMSMPPVSMTQVMPQATQMRPALLRNTFKKVCTVVKPLLA